MKVRKGKEDGGSVVRGRAIDFLGYQFFKEKTLMRKSIKKSFARRCAKIKNVERRKQVLAAYWGWCKWGDCKHLWKVLTNNDMSFAAKGIKQRERTKDGKKFFDVPSVRLMDILNVPITVLDFELGLQTKQGEDRCCVLIEHDGQRQKFITNCFNIKDILIQAREAEESGEKIFPVENCVIKRRALGDGKSAYYFDE